jgi:hypothetical protein
MTMAWPIGCHDTAWCELYRICGYHQCVHTGKGTALGAEIDAAIRRPLEAPQAENEHGLLAECLKAIARGRTDCGRALAREETRQLARTTLTTLGIDWTPAKPSPPALPRSSQPRD